MRKAAVVSLLAILVGMTMPAVASNDPYFAQQWPLRHIKAEDAWKTSKGAGVIIAVIDSGIDLAHEEFEGQLVPGYDYVNGDPTAQDDEGHGTHVGGIAAARADNGRGIAGVAPAAKIMPVKVLDENGEGSCNDVARGIDFAVSRGAHVLNLSLSERVPLFQCSAFDEGVARAVDAGRVVVIAAGNSAFPLASRATQDIALLVGATSPQDVKASYSNSGGGVRIYAPGGEALCDSPAMGVWSTYPVDKPGNCGSASKYAQLEGTSMAAPHVAGAAAAVLAINRGLSPSQVIDLIVNNSDRTADGFRRLNMAKAVAATPAGPSGPSGGSGGPSGPGGGGPSTKGGSGRGGGASASPSASAPNGEQPLAEGAGGSDGSSDGSATVAGAPSGGGGDPTEAMIVGFSLLLIVGGGLITHLRRRRAFARIRSS